MPTSDVTSSNATAPVDRLSLNVHDLRAGADVRTSGIGYETPTNHYCFDAGVE